MFAALRWSLERPGRLTTIVSLLSEYQAHPIDPHAEEWHRSEHSSGCISHLGSDILFPLQPPTPPHPDTPPGRPTREGLISVHFGSVWLRSAPFGSVWGLFRVRFGSVSGVLGVVVVGSVRGASVREKNITTLG